MVYGLIGAAAALALLLVILYNRLVQSRNLLREGWSGIDVQLKRRADLVPALVEVVKGYSGHEQKALQDVTALRKPQDVVGGLKQVLALVESYPDLKADKNFLELQNNLTEIEDNLQYARRYYNGCARNYNIKVQSFPGNLVAKAFGFKEEPYFEVEYATERKIPDVAF